MLDVWQQTGAQVTDSIAERITDHEKITVEFLIFAYRMEFYRHA